MRVVVGRPFWINTFNPVLIFRAFMDFKQQIKKVQWETRNGIKVLFFPYIVGKFVRFCVHGLSYRYSISRIAGKIKRDFNFNIIHAHDGYLDGFAGRYLSRRFETPLVITEHMGGPYSRLTQRDFIKRIILRSYAQADKILPVSKALENEIRSKLPREHHGKLECISNGINPGLFHTDPENSCVDGATRLLSVISFDENKNPFCLLRALKILVSRGHDLRLKIVGDGPLKNAVGKWAKDNNMAHMIELPGLLPLEEVARTMREDCDIFVLSSNYETFGVVVIEALASGKPVVSTRCGGPEGIITESYLGELCGKNDPVLLADAIEKVMDRIEDYPPEQISAFAHANYGYAKVAEKLKGLYSEL